MCQNGTVENNEADPSAARIFEFVVKELKHREHGAEEKG